jgi:hypothetical protein
VTKTPTLNRAAASQALYGKTTPTTGSTTPPSSTAADKFGRQAELGQRLYGNKYGHALSSFHTRFEAKHSGDPEALQASRAAREQHEKFFSKVGMDPNDAMTGLGRLLEYETTQAHLDRPRGGPAKSPEEKLKEREAVHLARAEQTFQTLRIELGSTEKAQESIAAHKRFMAAYKAEVPYFAGRAVEHGAQVDPEIVRIGAKYGAALPK